MPRGCSLPNFPIKPSLLEPHIEWLAIKLYLIDCKGLNTRFYRKNTMSNSWIVSTVIPVFSTFPRDQT